MEFTPWGAICYFSSVIGLASLMMRTSRESKNYTIDAVGKTLGRLASQVAVLLRGKDQPDFLPYLEPKNQIVVFNTDKIKVSGKKMRQKIYHYHSGYPGGLKVKSLQEAWIKNSRQVFQEAVYGMLPKNRLRDKIIRNLKLYKGKVGVTK